MSLTDWQTQAENIAHHYGKGKEVPVQDGWMTLCPAHGDSGTPNLHVSPSEDKILLHCHACGDTNKPELIKIVGSQFKLSEGKPKRQRVLKRDERGKWLNPAPSNAPSRPIDCYINRIHGARPPDSLWAYLDPSKQLMMYNARFNLTEVDGSTSKTYRRLALYLPATGPEEPVWSWFGPDTNLPLYGLEQLTGKWWERPLLLVEGEKAADAARILFPEMVVISFPGGANNYSKVDWSPLLGEKKVTHAILWPDNDKAGEAMAHGAKSLSTFLLKRGVRVKVVPVFKEKALPNKWDLADPIPDHWTHTHLVELLERAEYAEVGETSRISRYCAALASQSLPVDEFLTRSKQSCDSFNVNDMSPCRRCPQYNRIDCPEDINYMSDMQLDWLYITRHKSFFNLRTKEELDQQAFNALWASSPNHTLTGQTAASFELLQDPKTSKVYDHGYMPNGTLIMTDNNGRKRLNAWNGFALQPEYSTDPYLWLSLAEYLIPDTSIREHIFDWMAHLLQKPGIKVNHGLLLISATQGVGKDTFLEPIREIFGNGNCRDITSRSLDSAFNEYLLQTKLLIISELDTIGHRNSTYDYLKPLLAAPPTMLNVNVKGMKQIEIDNIIQVIAFSNKEVPVAIEDTDRRLMVYDIKHTQKQRWAPEKFQSYYLWLRNGGAKEVFGWLLKRDISSFDANAPAPNTEAKERMAEGADSRLAFLMDMVRNFVPPFHADLIDVKDVVTFFREEYGGRLRIGTFERTLARYNGGRLDAKLILGKDRKVLLALRHLEFWSKQSEATIKRAYEGGYIDMRAAGSSPNSPVTTAPQVTDDLEGF